MMIDQPKPALFYLVKLLLLLVLLPLAASAQTGAAFKQGEHGLLYRIVDPHAGPRIREGDFIYVNVIIKTDADSVLMSTYETGNAAPQILRADQQGGVMSAIKYLAEGDSAVIRVNIDSAFRKGAPEPVKGKYLFYQLRIEKLIPHPEPPDTTFSERVKAYLFAVSEKKQQLEPAKIKKYVTDNQLNPTVTPSGLNYVITGPGAGSNIAVGDTAVINYTCRYLSGKLLETNIPGLAAQNNSFYQTVQQKPLRLTLGQKHVIPGWEEGLLLLNKGAKAILITPSALAYGKEGFGPVGPYTPLVFEVEVVDIVKPGK